MMPIREVTAARPVISASDSSVVSQKPVSPPKPRHFDIENTKSKPKLSARTAICLFISKLGAYCGAVFDMRKPLLPIGRNTPSSSLLISPMGPPLCCEALQSPLQTFSISSTLSVLLGDMKSIAARCCVGSRPSTASAHKSGKKPREQASMKVAMMQP